jgi:hypothetical protein
VAKAFLEAIVTVTTMTTRRPFRGMAHGEPTQEEILEVARRLAVARLGVRDLPRWRPARTERLAIAKIDRAHNSVLAARAELRQDPGAFDGKKKLARAQLAEMLVARRAGFASYDDYRRACRPRTSFTATAFNRLRSYRELAGAEAAWARMRNMVLGDMVIDLRGDRASVGSGG